MEIIKQIQSFGQIKYGITILEISAKFFKNKALLIRKKNRILNQAVLVVESLIEIDLNDEGKIANMLLELEEVRSEVNDISFLNILVFNCNEIQKKNVFFANDSLRLEVSFVIIDKKNEKILFHKQSYAFSSLLRKKVIEDLAASLNYEVEYVSNR